MNISRWALPAFWLAPACGDDGGGASSGSDSSGAAGTTTSTTSTDGSTTAASSSGVDDTGTSVGESGPGSSSSTGADVELQHGFVRLLLQRDPKSAEDPFAGTSRIEITMTYEQCLFEFYAANPEWAQTGTQGEAVFGPQDPGGEGWLDRLCEVAIAELVDCQVETISQQLDPIPVLRVTYGVDAMLEDRVLPFGPLPGAELAQCEGGAVPSVRLTNGDAIRGFDGVTPVWHAQSFEPDSAVTDQAEPIVIMAERI